MQDHEIYQLGPTELQCGTVLGDARLAYKTYGRLNAAGDNAILMPTFYTGTHRRNQTYIETIDALDPSRYLIVSINMFGNGFSSSPSNTAAPFDGPRFPAVTLYDNVTCQKRLLCEGLGVRRVKLVTGWSMAACQAYQWAAQFPDMVDTILPFCGAAKTSLHNVVFLDSIKAALQADTDWNGGDYDAPPRRGLCAFGRGYAGWAFSRAFFRDHLYRQAGYGSVEDLLADWELDHLGWDANDLLAMLSTWRAIDISANRLYNGDLCQALAAIRARAILVPCTTDLIFPPEDSEMAAAHMPNAELRPYASAWGHCAATPGRDGEFARFLDAAMRDLLGTPA